MNTIWLAFLTGLTTGGISCVAVQGGLMSSAVTGGNTGESPSRRWSIVALFLVAKIIAYTILGFFLGLLGSSLTISPRVLGFVQIIVGLFLLATALRIANVHPIFRYVVLQPPRWVYRLMKKTSKRGDTFAPISLGLFSVLMPCGVTQAMMVAAIAAANPILSAGMMFAFTLGTSPVFFLLGMTMVKLLERKVFSYAAACIVFFFGIVSIDGGIALAGSFYTIQNIYKAVMIPVSELAMNRTGQVAGVDRQGRQEVTVRVLNNGYIPTPQAVKVGVPVRMSLVTDQTGGCTRAFTIPSLNVSKILPQTGTEIIEFTPVKTGKLAMVCGMGMYGSTIDVIP